MDQIPEELPLPRADFAGVDLSGAQDVFRGRGVGAGVPGPAGPGVARKRDQEVEVVRTKYAPKLAALQEKIRLAYEKLGANRPRQADRPGTPPLRWAARSWVR